MKKCKRWALRIITIELEKHKPERHSIDLPCRTIVEIMLIERAVGMVVDTTTAAIINIVVEVVKAPIGLRIIA